ncbi:uncharacterized protein LOC114120285 isoform X3 [Aphis gossypii]|uniref:uncharacterized protein LOC114120285 isoform X2 n=1 Tax=Aphis gossypii TaxID=80765 RepID=UPI00215987F2|nr:uncharacterized protein LOC114120285 isoform X2 [Aphis gossypii]XP_050055216.1 uncharacterized protein LOC114120285 isoform X3 [Aphis gossypii]
MEEVKIKNLNKSYMRKVFIVKGRVKYIKVEDKTSEGKLLNCILSDNSSEIEVVAFKDCDKVSKLLKIGKVVQIVVNKGDFEDNTYYKKTNHKYNIILHPEYSKITTINENEVKKADFPTHKFISGEVLKTLTSGKIIDVYGVLFQIDGYISAISQPRLYRKGTIKVDSTEIQVRFFGENAMKLYNDYNVGKKWSLFGVQYIKFEGHEYLSVDHSSKVRLTRPADLKDSTIESSVNRASISSPSSSNKNSTIESSIYSFFTSSPFSSNENITIGSPDQKPSTSGSTPCIKRKTQDFNVEEGTSKILKIDEPKESFSDEKFTKVVLNLLKNIKNNKEVVKLRIIEFISEILPEKDT